MTSDEAPSPLNRQAAADLLESLSLMARKAGLRLPPPSITVYTWATIADLTGFTADGIAALVAEWIGEPGYLHGGLPTQATLDLLLRQAAEPQPAE